MRALRTIGVVRAARFVCEQLIGVALNLCVLPQLRVALLRALGARIGRDTIVHGVTIINFYRGSFRHLQLGHNCYIGQQCLLDLAAPICLDDNLTLAPRVAILTHMKVGYENHPLAALYPSRQEGVHVGAGCFIGANATLTCGVEVGPNTLVAAGAVVDRNLPGGCLAAGVPARPRRQLALPALPAGKEGQT